MTHADFLRGLARAEFYDTNSATDNEYSDHLTAIARLLDECVFRLERLSDDCLAPDFNEHWDSYREMTELLAALRERP